MLRTARLVTIHGIGGSGKTRLAIEVTRQLRARDASLRDAVYWVPCRGSLIRAWLRRRPRQS